MKVFLRWVQEFRLNTMRMEFLSTSCGGTSSVMVRRSTFWYDSIQGNTKNSPAKIYHDKRWSLIYQCYKIKLIAVSTTILHISSVISIVKLFPDTYIISTFYNNNMWKNVYFQWMIYTLQVSKNNTMQLWLNKNDWIFHRK